jgi:hypothetical protein
MALFKSKEKNSQPPPKESPRQPRYTSIARVRINGFEGEAALRNVSIGGFRMESRTYAAMTVGEHYTIQIMPEAASGIKLIELEVDVRWIQSTETSFSSGFLIIKHPLGPAFEQYLEYIKNQSGGA